MQVSRQKVSISSKTGRSPIDEETKLKLFSCLEEWNKHRHFINEFRMEGDKKIKIGMRPVTEQDKTEERKLAIKMLK